MTVPSVAQPPTVHQINRSVKYVDNVLWVHCSVSQRWFHPASVQESGDLIWTSCPFCDTSARSQGDAGYDATAPQPHAYFLEKTLAFEGRA
jgi:hypothetical protein